MPATTVSRRLVTAAMLDILVRSTKQPAGDHKAPVVSRADTAGWPYTIVYSLPGGTQERPNLRAPNADGLLVYQVTSVGLNREQAEWMADRVRLTLLGRDARGRFQVELQDIDGTRILDRMGQEGLPGIIAEGTPPNEVFSVAERYVLATTPA